jgi:hypothetical protein
LRRWCILASERGHSSVGRAVALQASGRRFDPVCLHHPALPWFSRPEISQFAALYILSTHALLIDIVNVGFCLQFSHSGFFYNRETGRHGKTWGVHAGKTSTFFNVCSLMRRACVEYGASTYAAKPSTRRTSGDAPKSFHVELSSLSCRGGAVHESETLPRTTAMKIRCRRNDEYQ